MNLGRFIFAVTTLAVGLLLVFGFKQMKKNELRDRGIEIVMQFLELSEKSDFVAAHNLMDPRYRELQGPDTTEQICVEITQTPIASPEDWLFSVSDGQITISPHVIDEETDWGTAYVLTETAEGLRFTGEIVEFQCDDGRPI